MAAMQKTEDGDEEEEEDSDDAAKDAETDGEDGESIDREDGDNIDGKDGDDAEAMMEAEPVELLQRLTHNVNELLRRTSAWRAALSGGTGVRGAERFEHRVRAELRFLTKASFFQKVKAKAK